MVTTPPDVIEVIFAVNALAFGEDPSDKESEFEVIDITGFAFFILVPLSESDPVKLPLKLESLDEDVVAVYPFTEIESV